MNEVVSAFTKTVIATYQLAGSVLDVGGYDVNGTIRDLFTGPYVSTDMRDGPGVDKVINAHDLADHYNGEFDIIVCAEMLEHDDAPWLSLQAMAHACKPGGHLILTCRGYDERGCIEPHNHPDDFWRFSVGGIQSMLRHTGWTEIFAQPDPESPGVLALAQR